VANAAGAALAWPSPGNFNGAGAMPGYWLFANNQKAPVSLYSSSSTSSGLACTNRCHLYNDKEAKKDTLQDPYIFSTFGSKPGVSIISFLLLLALF
jgi:hypothetical protein